MSDELSKVKKPILDEQQLWENEVKLQMALHNNLTVELKVYNNGSFINVKGKILLMDSVHKSIRLDDDELEFQEISFNDIISVTVL